MPWCNPKKFSYLAVRRLPAHPGLTKPFLDQGCLRVLFFIFFFRPNFPMISVNLRVVLVLEGPDTSQPEGWCQRTYLIKIKYCHYTYTSHSTHCGGYRVTSISHWHGPSVDTTAQRRCQGYINYSTNWYWGADLPQVRIKYYPLVLVPIQGYTTFQPVRLSQIPDSDILSSGTGMCTLCS